MKKSFVLLILLMLFLCACTAALPSDGTSSDSASSDSTSKGQNHISNIVSEMHTESFFEASSQDDVIALPEDSSMQESSEESIEDSTEESSQAEEVKTVMIDPGHGFGDVGCTFPDTKVYEKKVVLTLAHKIGAELEKYGINVLYTHDGESFMSKSELNELATSMEIDYDAFLRRLIKECSNMTETEMEESLKVCHAGINENNIYGGHERSYYTNLMDAQQEISLFLSVHVNTNTDSNKLKGFELYYCSDMPYASESLALLKSMQTVLLDRFSDRHARAFAYKWEDGNIVNKYVDMPSVLIESGYATTPSDSVDLQNEQWQNDFARAIADSIVQYLYGA